MPPQLRTDARLRLDPRLSGLGALGVECVEQLLGDGGEPLQRAEPLPSIGERERVRFPLPGTPENAGGGLTGRPQGAGTGWVVLERWRRASLGALFRSRLTAPRSASLAERRWNLLCHLRAHGVGAPEPLAVGASGNGLVSRASFLVTREVEGFEPVPDWLAREARPDVRRRGLRAIGELLRKLLAARVALPALAPEDLLIAPAKEASGASSCDEPGFSGLRRNRLPSVLLAEVGGGTIRAELSDAELVQTLLCLDRSTPDRSTRGLTRGERLRLLVVVLRGLPAARRRSIVRALDPV